MNRFDLATLIRTAPTTRDRIGEPYTMRPGKRREITSTWVVGSGHTDPDNTQHGEEGTIVLDLTTYHYRKELTSTVRVSIQCGGMVQTSMAFGARGESYTAHRAPCARFSAKAMRDHHARALYLVQECSSDHVGMSLEQGVAQYLPSVTA